MRRRPELRCVCELRAGYSLFETLVALAVLSLGAAFIIPRASATMDQVVAHAAFFEFQRQVSELRRHAFRADNPLVLVSAESGPQTAALGRSAVPVTIELQSGWSYRLSEPLLITGGGKCGATTADLIRSGRVRVHLATRDTECHFTRLS